MADVGKSSNGLNANIAGLLAYTLGVISGLIFFLIEKDSKFVKFHAMQAILFSVAVFIISTVLAFIPVIGWALISLVQLAALVVWIILMVKAYKGEWFQLPVIGKIAAKQVGGIEPDAAPSPGTGPSA